MQVDYRTFQLRTPRLIVRPMALADYRSWVQANADMLPSQNPFDVGRRPPADITWKKFRELVAARKKLWAEDRFYMMNVFQRKAGGLVGLVNVIPIIRSTVQTAAIGYAINNNHWRKGYASEAVVPVMRFAFKTLKFHRLTAEVLPDNRPSIAAVRKLGFRKEGRAKRWVHDHGKWRDVYFFALTAEDWGIEGMKPEVRKHFTEV